MVIGEGRRGGRGKMQRTIEEVALLDAELAYAGAEAEEGEAEDGAEQCHGCRCGYGSIGRVTRSVLRKQKVVVTCEAEIE